jgi:hypothetical protein
MSVIALPHERWPTRAVHPADQAQARIFEQALRHELDELEGLAARTEDEEIRRFNVRINEVRRLLIALQRRFNR